MKKYTLEDLWKEYEKYISWLDSRPPWWKFRARRKWKKAEPLNKKQEGESIRYGDHVELTDDRVKKYSPTEGGLMRKKLIELIIDAKRSDPETGSFTEYLADHLIANGLILPEFLKIRETKYIPPFDFDEENSRPNALVFLACGEKIFSLAVPITSGKNISCRGCLYMERRQKKCNMCSRSYYMRDYYTTEPTQEDE